MSDHLSPLDPGGLLLAAALFFGFIVALFVGSRLVPGTRAQGAPLPGGARETYTLNGFRLFLCVSLGAAAILALRPSALARVHTAFFPLLVVANVAAFSFSAYLTLREQGAAPPRAPRLRPRLLLRRRSQPQDRRRRSQALLVPPFVDGPRPPQRLVRGRAVPGARLRHDPDVGVPGILLCLSRQLLPVRARHDLHLGHPRRALRLDARLGRLRARPLLLQPPGLVPRPRHRPSAGLAARGACHALRGRVRPLPRIEPAEAPVQGRPDAAHLGASRRRPSEGGSSARGSGGSGASSTTRGSSVSTSRGA